MLRRSAAVGGPAAGHYPNARKPGHPHPLPLLHLWSRWGAAVEGHAASAMLCTPQCNRTHHIAAILPPSFSPRHRQCPNLVQPLHMRFTWCVLFVEPSSVMSLNDAALLLLTHTHTHKHTDFQCPPDPLHFGASDSGNFSVCRSSGPNPFAGVVSFDNIALACVTIFQVRFNQNAHLSCCCLLPCAAARVYAFTHTHTHTYTHNLSSALSPTPAQHAQPPFVTRVCR